MAAILGVNLYTSVVDANSWAASIPASVMTARDYFKVVNPGTYFRMASPLNQLFALLALIAGWKFGRNARIFFGLALVFAVLTDVMTFAYFYPRNAVLFGPSAADPALLTRIVSEWRAMNWVRSLIVAVGLVCSMKGLDAMYRSKEQS